MEHNENENFLLFFSYLIPPQRSRIIQTLIYVKIEE